ncbi:MAG TPA: flagellar filament capping protein FliD [Mycobacterium sp.]|nr:flagellar filament capping protein FliD [Mycobacterium sp.]
MTSFNISGLSSGIDTASLISQLMTVAARPQTALKTQLSGLQSTVAAYQDINTKIAAVKTAADTLAGADAWAATAATSSDTSVVATGSTSAITGTSTTFTVNKVAKAQVSTVAIADASNAADIAAGIDVTDVNGLPHHIALTNGSAAGVAAAINSASVGVRAAVITTDTGTMLQLTSSTTGESGAFSISGLSAAAQTVTQAQNAKITVGDPSAGGYTVTSPTNTFANAIPGVTFTVSAEVADVTIGVNADATSISGAVKNLVTAVNSVLSTINTDTAQGSVLSGDRLMADVTQQMLGIVSAGSSGKSYSTAGISLTSTGSLTFDPVAFASAYAADPAATQAMVGTTMSAAYAKVGDNVSNSTTGTLTQAMKSDTDQESSLSKRIADWDTKLADQKLALTTRYAAMESALSKLKSQSAYLASMFDAMSSSSSSSSSSSN